MVKLIDLLHQKIELFRLEQRYTRRRNRRSTFRSEAQYVDGEYIYTNNSSPSSFHSSPKSPQTTTTAYEAKSSGGSDSDEVGSPVESHTERAQESKASKRLSRMGSVMDWRKGKGVETNTVSVREVKWER